jgi:hypothetical protein
MQDPLCAKGVIVGHQAIEDRKKEAKALQDAEKQAEKDRLKLARVVVPKKTVVKTPSARKISKGKPKPRTKVRTVDATESAKDLRDEWRRSGVVPISRRMSNKE